MHPGTCGRKDRGRGTVEEGWWRKGREMEGRKGGREGRKEITITLHVILLQGSFQFNNSLPLNDPKNLKVLYQYREFFC